MVIGIFRFIYLCNNNIVIVPSKHNGKYYDYKKYLTKVPNINERGI